MASSEIITVMNRKMSMIELSDKKCLLVFNFMLSCLFYESKISFLLLLVYLWINLFKSHDVVSKVGLILKHLRIWVRLAEMSLN